MNDTTNAWLAEYDRAIQRVAGITTGLSEAQANWKPAPKKWSITECMDHLNQSMGTYGACMAPAIAKAKAKGKTGNAPYDRGTFIGRFILKTLKKGSGSNLPAPGVFKPTASHFELASVRQKLTNVLTGAGEMLKQADGLAMGKVVFGTPVSALVRVSLAQAFELHAIHTHRHLDQMERVKQHADFPKA
ncbi:MAG: DinB family protein [Planctomycetes bacterium]|nr:DinB family protein [Planctomycetota bacterium]